MHQNANSQAMNSLHEKYNNLSGEVMKLRELRKRSESVDKIRSNPSSPKGKTPTKYNFSNENTFNFMDTITNSRNSKLHSKNIKNPSNISEDHQNMSKKISINEDVSILKRQYQKTFQSLYESNLESSKLRFLLDYSLKDNHESLNHEIHSFILKKHHEHVSKSYKTSHKSNRLSSPSHANDIKVHDLVVNDIYNSIMIERELKIKIKENIDLQTKYELEQKKVEEKEYSLLKLRDTLSVSLVISFSSS